MFHNVACSTSPPDANPVEGVPPVLNTAAVEFWIYEPPRIFMSFATLNNDMSSYASWLLDLFRQTLIFHNPVWFF